MMRYTFSLLLLLTLWLSSHAQNSCWPEGFTHDTRPTEHWLSCETTPSPNPDRGESLWLMYDFGYTYGLTTTYLWNYNEPGATEMGITELAIDYSLDGQNWETWGVFDLDLATGQRNYGGQEGPDLTGVTARFVLLTALSTGEVGNNCAGLGEVRFNLDPTVDVSEVPQVNALRVAPNPTRDRVQILLPGQSIQQLVLFDSQGKEVFSQNGDFNEQMTLNLSAYPSGMYLLQVQDRTGQVHQQKITKLY